MQTAKGNGLIVFTLGIPVVVVFLMMAAQLNVAFTEAFAAMIPRCAITELNEGMI